MDSGGSSGDQPADPWAGLTELERLPLRATRRVIARRLSDTWRDVVPVTLHRDLDVSAVTIKVESGGPRLLDLVLHATTRALLATPAFNAVFDGSVRRVFAEVNIGLAVDTPKGLLVPVLRNVQAMSMADIGAARRTATDLVLGWGHSAADLIGGTFTISNLGPLGIDFFTPVINGPQVAILGLGRLRRQAVGWSGGSGVEPRSLLPASLTVDHRVLDGADGARFLQTLQLHLNALSGDEREPLSQ